jgi:hypothetical protein
MARQQQRKLVRLEVRLPMVSSFSYDNKNIHYDRLFTEDEATAEGSGILPLQTGSDN